MEVDIPESQKKGVSPFGTTDNRAHMLYFRDLESLKNGTPAWKLKNVSGMDLLFFQVPGTEWVAVITKKNHSPSKREIALINPSGEVEGRIEVNGKGNPFVLFTGHRYGWACGQQAFRLRESRPGDASRYVTEILSQRRYFYDTQCARSLEEWDGNWNLRYRLFNRNQVAAFESEVEFELNSYENRVGNESCPSIWNRKGEVALDNKPVEQLTELFQITDAVINDQGGVIVHTRNVESKAMVNGFVENRQELGISYFGNRIPKNDKVSK